MGKNKSVVNEVQGIANEARESFDLGDFLRGRSVRTETVRVFTDEVTAEKRGGFEATTRQLANGMQVPDIRSWGLVADLAEVQGKLEALESKATKEARELKSKEKALKDEIRALTETLLETALDIEFQSVPPVIKKDAWRAAKKARGINGKVAEVDLEDVLEEQAAQLLVRTVVSYTKHGTGEKNEGITLKAARDLKALLPDSEWAKVEKVFGELLYKNVIGEQAVTDTDF